MKSRRSLAALLALALAAAMSMAAWAGAAPDLRVEQTAAEIDAQQGRDTADYDRAVSKCPLLEHTNLVVPGEPPAGGAQIRVFCTTHGYQGYVPGRNGVPVTLTSAGLNSPSGIFILREISRSPGKKWLVDPSIPKVGIREAMHSPFTFTPQEGKIYGAFIFEKCTYNDGFHTWNIYKQIRENTARGGPNIFKFGTWKITRWDDTNNPPIPPPDELPLILNAFVKVEFNNACKLPETFDYDTGKTVKSFVPMITVQFPVTPPEAETYHTYLGFTKNPQNYRDSVYPKIGGYIRTCYDPHLPSKEERVIDAKKTLREEFFEMFSYTDDMVMGVGTGTLLEDGRIDSATRYVLLKYPEYQPFD